MWLAPRSHSKCRNYHFEPRWCDSRVYALKHNSIWIRELRHWKVPGTHSRFSREDLIIKTLFSWSSIQYSKCKANQEEPAPFRCTLHNHLPADHGDLVSQCWVRSCCPLCLIKCLYSYSTCYPTGLTSWDLKLTLFGGTTVKDTQLWIQSYEHLCIYYEK